MLGLNASSALGWLFIEVALILISLQVLSVKSLLKTFDIVAFAGYKYFGLVFHDYQVNLYLFSFFFDD